MSDLNFKVITSEMTIKASEYQSDENSMNNVFASGHWLLGNVGKKNISMVNMQGTKIVNALHLKHNYFFGANIAEIVGEPFIQYNDIISNDAAGVEQFLNNTHDALPTNNISALHLRNVRIDAKIYSYCQKFGMVIKENNAPCLDMTKFKNFDEYLASMSKSTRKTYRNFFKKLNVEHQYYINDEITKDLAKQIIKLKTDQLALIGQSSRAFAQDINIEKLINLVSTPSDDFKTIASITKCNGKLASASISFVKGKNYYGYVLAMGSDFSKYCPGNNQILLNIKWAFDNGLEYFDLLSPEDDYKLRWTKGRSIPVYDFLIPMNKRGKIYGHLYLKTIRPILKSIYLFLKKYRFKLGFKG